MVRVDEMEKNLLLTDNNIQYIIYDIRGVKVILDYDFASVFLIFSEITSKCRLPEV